MQLRSLFGAIGIAAVCLPTLFAEGPPASYDLRSVNGGTQAWVPEVQNQGAAEDCWTFAAATAMNSNLLKTGLLPASPVPPPISVSSWHLSTNNGAPDQLLASEAFSATSNWSGFNYQALGYVTRGSGQWQVPGTSTEVIPGVGFRYQQTMGGGPVLDSQNPLNPFPASISERSGYPAYLGSLVPPANQPIAYRVGSMRFHDQGYSNNVPFPSPTGTTTLNGVSIDTFTFDLGAADPQVAAVKNAILANGAATTCMNGEGNFQYGVGASGNTTQYFNDQTAPAWLTHVVTIIGWDDDHTITDPSTSATTTGAWLVQNSWGTGTNSDGTFWASYNDAVIGRVGVSTYTMLDNAPYSSTVIQNELGPTRIGSFFDSIWAGPTTSLPIPSGMPTVAHHTAAAVLTPASDGELRAIGLFTQLANVLIDVAIYETWDNGPSGFLGGSRYTLDDIGYFQVELPESLTLTAADSIVVQLTYLDALTLDPALGALGITIGGSGLNFDSSTNSVASGLSYYLDGSAWTDFATLEYPLAEGPGGVTGGVLFLKGITAVPEPSTLLLVLVAATIGMFRLRVGGKTFHVAARRIDRGPEASERAGHICR
jgi:hypothetical protein